MDYQLEIYNVSQWMKNYAEKAGSDGYVVGLSGGIDSAVVACLAVKALGKDNVIGVSIPCQTKDESMQDAAYLSMDLGIALRVFPIDEAYENFYSRLLPGKKETHQLTQANMKARLRMTVLYMMANQFNYLVAGTGNLSELMVGYCTKYGDGGVDIESLGNYYKSEVYKMAELMPEIPDSTKTKAPSADLWEGQTDEEELGMSYVELDTILRDINRQGLVLPSTILALGEEKTGRVQSMIKTAEHKNNTPPRYKRNS